MKQKKQKGKKKRNGTLIKSFHVLSDGQKIIIPLTVESRFTDPCTKEATYTVSPLSLHLADKFGLYNNYYELEAEEVDNAETMSYREAEAIIENNMSLKLCVSVSDIF